MRLSGILLAILFLTGSLQASSPAQVSLKDFVEKRQKRHGYAFYVQDVKFGWSMVEMKPAKHEGQSVARQDVETLTRVQRNGVPAEVKATTTTLYSLKGKGDILYCKESETEGNVETIYVGQPKGEMFEITRTRGSEVTKRLVAFPKDNLRKSIELESWLKAEPKVGAKHEAFTFEMAKKDVNQVMSYQYRGKKSVVVSGVATEVYQVDLTMDGAKLNALVTPAGDLLKANVGILEVRTESLTTLKKMDVKGIDIFGLASIYVKKDLGDPEKVRKLTLEVTGLGDFSLPTSHRQKVTRTKDGAVLVHLTQDAMTETAVPLTQKERTELLSATPSIDSDDERIRALAKKIVADESDPVKKATLLKRWVYENLRKSLAANASTATQVLQQKAGDCTEHALLFLALARAVGLPARELSGVAFGHDDKRPLFGWHAWAEIHTGKQWVSVDPMWDQVLVDATHVTFGVGQDDDSSINVIGKVKFKVVDFESRK